MIGLSGLGNSNISGPVRSGLPPLLLPCRTTHVKLPHGILAMQLERTPCATKETDLLRQPCFAKIQAFDVRTASVLIDVMPTATYKHALRSRGIRVDVVILYEFRENTKIAGGTSTPLLNENATRTGEDRKTKAHKLTSDCFRRGQRVHLVSLRCRKNTERIRRNSLLFRRKLIGCARSYAAWRSRTGWFCIDLASATHEVEYRVLPGMRLSVIY